MWDGTFTKIKITVKLKVENLQDIMLSVHYSKNQEYIFVAPKHKHVSKNGW